MASSTPISSGTAHLLVPVDFSNHSRAALRRAAEMIRIAGDGKLTLLSVVDPPTSGLRIQTSELHQQMEEDAMNRLRELAHEEVPDLQAVHLEVAAGRPADAICAQAAKLGADMIVISTHGRSGLSHYLIGSVAESVVRHATCPVLVFR